MAPEARTADSSAADRLPARLQTLTRRADFLAANAGLRVARHGFVLLARPNPAANGPQVLRFGITVTKRIGNAVVRNRMKRRLRALLREVLPQAGLPGHDHVLIGREGGVERDFAKLRAELLAALEWLRAGRGDAPREAGRGARDRPGGGPRNSPKGSGQPPQPQPPL